MTEMERILGVKFRRDKTIIPGTIPNEDREIIYFSDNGTKNFKKQFNALTDSMPEPGNVKGGAIIEEGFSLLLPDGSLFHAVRYHTDIEGWRKDVETAAQTLNITLGKIEEDKIVLSDGKVFALADCKGIPKSTRIEGSR